MEPASRHTGVGPGSSRGLEPGHRPDSRLFFRYHPLYRSRGLVILSRHRLSVFVLRHKEPGILRPYKVLAYPLVPLIFSACCIFMLFSSSSYALLKKPIGLLFLLAVILLGVIVYWFSAGWKHRRSES